MEDAKISGTLHADSASIGRHLLMRRGEFNDVNLRNSTVGGVLAMNGATFASRLNIEAITTGGRLDMRESRVDVPAIAGFVRIGGSLDLRGARLNSLNLTGAQVEGELRVALSNDEPIWQEGALLTLRNARVQAVQDTANAWPEQLELDGFEYRRLGGLGESDIIGRGSEWYVDWLARDEPYTPQPHRYLAKVLLDMGHVEGANDVLYSGRVRARIRAYSDGHYSRWIGLWLLQLTIGYGIGGGYFFSLVWVACFVGIGWAVVRWRCHFVPDRDGNSAMKIGFWYSLDMLLPVIQLRQRHYDIDLPDGVRHYFYAHQIVGYTLVSCIIAGLAGPTQ